MLLPIIPPPMIRISNDRSKALSPSTDHYIQIRSDPQSRGRNLNGTALAHYKETDRRESAPGHKEEGQQPLSPGSFPQRVLNL